MKLSIFFSLLVTIVLLEQCSNETSTNQYVVNPSELYAASQSQLVAFDEFKKSELEHDNLRAMAEDRTYNLSIKAGELLMLANKLDSASTVVIRQIDQLKIKLFERYSGKTIPINSPFIIKQSFLDMSPIVFNLDEILSSPSINNWQVSSKEIETLKKNLEDLRKLHIGVLQQIRNTNNLKKIKFTNFSEHYQLTEQAHRKAMRFSCNAGEQFRIEQINLNMSYNDYQLKAIFSSDASPATVSNNLSLLQIDLLKIRTKVHELLRIHLRCQELKLKNSNESIH